MKADQAIEKMTEVIRRKHLALSTEQCYCAWLRRYCDYLLKVPGHLKSEQKLGQFLTALAKDGVAASTQNQAFNAIVFFYQEVVGVPLANIQALRARRPEQVRHTPSRDDTLRLLQAVQADAEVAVSLAVRLLYGCGLRVTEPLSLRIKDVDLAGGQLTIRAAKGGKDRVVAVTYAATGGQHATVLMLQWKVVGVDAAFGHDTTVNPAGQTIARVGLRGRSFSCACGRPTARGRRSARCRR